MDWARAKNIIIVLLLIVNGTIGVFNYINGQKYQLPDSFQKSMETILKENNVLFEPTLIKDFTPKKRMILERYEFKDELLTRVFFQHPEQLLKVGEADQIEYENEEGHLVIEMDAFRFEAVQPQVVTALDEEKAQLICDNIIKKMGVDFQQFVLDKKFTTYEGDQYIFYYRQNFEGYMINSNYIRFEIDGEGLESVECEYMKPMYFADEKKREIFSSAEALLTLMKELQNTESGEMIVNDMRLVYNYVESDNNDKNLYAVPCYSIYLYNEEYPLLINAYHNMLEKS